MMHGKAAVELARGRIAWGAGRSSQRSSGALPYVPTTPERRAWVLRATRRVLVVAGEVLLLAVLLVLALVITRGAAHAAGVDPAPCCVAGVAGAP